MRRYHQSYKCSWRLMFTYQGWNKFLMSENESKVSPGDAFSAETTETESSAKTSFHPDWSEEQTIQTCTSCFKGSASCFSLSGFLPLTPSEIGKIRGSRPLACYLDVFDPAAHQTVLLKWIPADIKDLEERRDVNTRCSLCNTHTHIHTLTLWHTSHPVWVSGGCSQDLPSLPFPDTHCVLGIKANRG